MIKCLLSECPLDFSISGSTCYYVSSYQVDWDSAHTECENMGGQLAIIKSQDKQTEIEFYLENIADTPGKLQIILFNIIILR